ncbi:MAG: RnfABCDGE type electron transport complex subunit D, partial [Dethiobacteria bacterium]
VLAGGVMLGALFMATDMVTTPVTARGKLIFGIGCGIITMMIRLWGTLPEGVTFAILLMNAVTPIIDNFTVPQQFGGVKKSA